MVLLATAGRHDVSQDAAVDVLEHEREDRGLATISIAPGSVRRAGKAAAPATSETSHDEDALQSTG